MSRHPSSQRFHDILTDCGNLHDRKSLDYGADNDPFANVRASEEWGIEPWVGALIRLNDKVKRLQKAAKGGTLEFEGVVDSLNDILVYAGIARVLYEEREHSNQKIHFVDGSRSARPGYCARCGSTSSHFSDGLCAGCAREPVSG